MLSALRERSVDPLTTITSALDVTSKQKPDGSATPVVWNHISQPLTSSAAAVNIVIDEVARVASTAGVQSTVVAAANMDIAFAQAKLLPADFSGDTYSAKGQLPLRVRLADTIRGWSSLDREHIGRMYRSVGEALRASEGPIIVHDGYLGAAGLVTLRRMFPDRPIILWMHQTLSRGYSPREVRRFLSLADTVICVSDWIRDSLHRAARSSLVDGRLVTVLNGVDTERFKPAQDSPEATVPSILFVGRVVKAKGPDVLAAALSDLHSEGVDFRATFIGVAHPDVSGETRYEHAVRKQTAAFSDKVHFIPFRPHSELPDVYREHQILVVPSKYEEPCSLALIEGMASGLAAVAARRGGMPQVGADAVQFFERRSELTEVLRALLPDAQLRSHCGTLARARAEQLTWSHTFGQARDLISPGVGSEFAPKVT